MRNLRPAIVGLLAAAFSIIIMCGSLLLSLTEGRIRMVTTPPRTPTTTTPSTNPTQTSSISPTPSTTFEASPTDEPTITASFSPTKSPTGPPTTGIPTPTFPPSPTICSPPSDWSQISIEAGETLESIAQTYGTTIEELTKINCLMTTNLIPGTILYVPGSPSVPPIQCGPPPGWVSYRVKPGDNLFRIGLAYGLTFTQMQLANCLGSSTEIRIGQELYVPNIPTLTPKTSATATATTNPSLSPTPTPTTLPPTPTPTSTTFVPSTNTPSSTSTATTLVLTSTPTATSTPQITATPTMIFNLTSSITPEPSSPGK